MQLKGHIRVPLSSRDSPPDTCSTGTSVARPAAFRSADDERSSPLRVLSSGEQVGVGFVDELVEQRAAMEGGMEYDPESLQRAEFPTDDDERSSPN